MGKLRRKTKRAPRCIGTLFVFVWPSLMPQHDSQNSPDRHDSSFFAFFDPTHVGSRRGTERFECHAAWERDSIKNNQNGFGLPGIRFPSDPTPQTPRQLNGNPSPAGLSGKKTSENWTVANLHILSTNQVGRSSP